MNKWLILPDMHGSSYVDLKTLKVVEKYMRSEHWNGLIYLGDVIDLYGASVFFKSGNLKDSDFIISQFDWASKMLRRHREAVGWKARIIYRGGNHEDRLRRYVEDRPELTGLLDIREHLPLKELKIEYHDYDTLPTRIGRAHFTHGRRYDMYHSKWVALEHGTNIFYGHTHDVQEFSVKQLCQNHIYVGKSLGCLCVDDIDYMAGRANRWQQAFAVFYFREGGFFNEFTVKIFDHKFVSPEGRLWK